MVLFRPAFLFSRAIIALGLCKGEKGGAGCGVSEEKWMGNSQDSHTCARSPLGWEAVLGATLRRPHQ